ncbi:hypothetical protein ACINWC743_A0556 [Acinetobacter sp. WC-743]|nr:hypothetical protein ACINWC743_A0556 [Acinetobacter sp. WC-743]
MLKTLKEKNVMYKGLNVNISSSLNYVQNFLSPIFLFKAKT